MMSETILENKTEYFLHIGFESTTSTHARGGLLKTINPGEVAKYNTAYLDCGCAKLDVYISLGPEIDGQKAWSGIIPLGSAEAIKIETDPSTKKIKVSAADGTLPQCQPECQSQHKETKLDNEKKTPRLLGIRRTPDTWWWILLFLTVLLGVYLLKHHIL